MTRTWEEKLSHGLSNPICAEQVQLLLKKECALIKSVGFKQLCALRSVMSDSLWPHGLACQAPLSVGFSRQEYWSGLPFPPPAKSSWPRDFSGVILCLLHWQEDPLLLAPPGKLKCEQWPLWILSKRANVPKCEDVSQQPRVGGISVHVCFSGCRVIILMATVYCRLSSFVSPIYN